MTNLFRHTILLAAIIGLFVACEDNAIPSDKLGTDGITQGTIHFDTIQNMRDASGDTLSIDEAIRIGLTLPAGTGAESKTTKSYYILGYVKGFSDDEGKEDFSTSFATYGNRYPILTNKYNSKTMMCYRLMSFKGAKFTDLNQLKVGDIVVVYGQIQNYKNAPQVSSGQLVTSDNPESGYVPKPKVLVNETFNDGIGAFATVTEQSASAEVWTHVPAEGGETGFMLATAYINGANEASESMLVSPAMDLTVCTRGAIMTFSHYYEGKAADRDNFLRVLVSKNGGAWEKLPVDKWGKDEQFKTATIDLAEYVSSNTKVAFAYKSTTETAMTWAVKNVRIGEPEQDE